MCRLVQGSALEAHGINCGFIDGRFRTFALKLLLDATTTYILCLLQDPKPRNFKESFVLHGGYDYQSSVRNPYAWECPHWSDSYLIATLEADKRKESPLALVVEL